MPRLEGLRTRIANPALVFACRLGCQEPNIGFAYMVNHGQTEVVGFYWTDTGSVIVNPERDGSVAISL